MRGQIVKYLQGHVGDIRSVAFHPNGHLLASGGADHIVQLWDVESGKSVRTLRGHTNMVKALAFSPDGRWLASGGTDRTIRLWPMEDASATNSQGGLVLHGHDDDIDRACLQPRWAHPCQRQPGPHGAPVGHRQRARIARPARASPCPLRCCLQPRWRACRHQQLWTMPHLSGMRTVGSLQNGGVTMLSAALVVAFHPDGELFACITAEHDDRNSTCFHRCAAPHLVWTHKERFYRSPSAPQNPSWQAAVGMATFGLWNAETGACLDSLHSPGPYAGMNITGVTGITEAQKAALMALGAYEQSNG